MTLPFNGVPRIGSRKVGTGQWDPANKSTKVSLRGVNSVAVSNNAADDTIWHRTRSLIGHLGGKAHAEVHIQSASPNMLIGLGTGDEGMDSGNSGFAAGVYWSPNGQVQINSGDGLGADTLLAAGSLPWQTGDRLVFEADTTNWLLFLKRVRAGVATSWNNNGSANPATNSGGLTLARIPAAPSPPNSRTLFVMPSMRQAPDTAIAFFDGGFLVAPSSGYSNWG